MSTANEALADVRGWLCDNLSDGEAGKVCGMLSVVSRRISELEAENAKLRELATALEDCRHTTCDDCVRWDYPNGGCYLDDVMRELGIEVES